MLIEREMNESPWPAYVEHMAAAQGYTLDEAQTVRVAEQMALVARVAEPLLALQLAAEVEPAAVFRP